MIFFLSIFFFPFFENGVTLQPFYVSRLELLIVRYIYGLHKDGEQIDFISFLSIGILFFIFLRSVMNGSEQRKQVMK